MVQNHLKTHFLNVSNNGMGDCTIIELPDNQIMMVDVAQHERKKQMIHI